MLIATRNGNYALLFIVSGFLTFLGCYLQNCKFTLHESCSSCMLQERFALRLQVMNENCSVILGLKLIITTKNKELATSILHIPE